MYVVEGTRERVQVFEGIVIRRQGGGVRETFTVRKVSFGVGVERTFPVHSPSISRIEVGARGRVRRAKLYYLRDLRGKKARIRERRDDLQSAGASQSEPEPELEDDEALSAEPAEQIEVQATEPDGGATAEAETDAEVEEQD